MSEIKRPLEEGDTALAVRESDPKIKEPIKHAVYLHNDNYTSMEFVVEALVRFFKKTDEEATLIMLKVHSDGRGLAGVYTQEIAEMKAAQVMNAARARGFPPAARLWLDSRLAPRARPDRRGAPVANGRCVGGVARAHRAYRRGAFCAPAFRRHVARFRRPRRPPQQRSARLWGNRASAARRFGPPHRGRTAVDSLADRQATRGMRDKTGHR